MKTKGYILFDATWNRLVRWVETQDHCEAALFCADPSSKSRGPTLFPTKTAARVAIRVTRKLKQYAWASNNYVIYEVHQ